MNGERNNASPLPPSSIILYKRKGRQAQAAEVELVQGRGKVLADAAPQHRHAAGLHVAQETQQHLHVHHVWVAHATDTQQQPPSSVADTARMKAAAVPATCGGR